MFRRQKSLLSLLEMSIFCFRFHDSVISPTDDDFEPWVRGQITSIRWGTVISCTALNPSPQRHLGPASGGGGGGVLGLSFAGYVPLASQSPCPIIVYFVAVIDPILVIFWENVIFAIPTKSLAIYASTFKNGMYCEVIVTFNKQQLFELFNQDHFESLLNRIFSPQKSENA